MRSWHAAPGSPYSDEDAEAVGPALQELAEKGASTSSDILEAARDRESPLHPYFDWNDDSAAEKWRRSQAGRLARSIMVKVKVGGEYQSMRAFHVVQVQRETPEGGSSPARVYMDVRQVRESEAASEQVVEEARRRLQAWYDRYQQYREVFQEGAPEMLHVLEEVERGLTAA